MIEMEKEKSQGTSQNVNIGFKVHAAEEVGEEDQI